MSRRAPLPARSRWSACADERGSGGAAPEWGRRARGRAQGCLEGTPPVTLHRTRPWWWRKTGGTVAPVRTITLASLLLCVACGSSQPEPVSAPAAVDGQPAGADPSGVAASTVDDGALINEAKAFVKEMDADLRTLYVNAAVAAWANETDITPEHEAAAAKAGAEQAKGITRWIKASRKFDAVRDKLDETTRRQLVLLQFAGQPAPDDPKKADELARLG